MIATIVAMIAFSGLMVAGCGTGNPSAKVRYAPGPDISAIQNLPPDGPKARIAVTKFINKAAKANAELGSGMADMLATALFNSQRFIVLDRQDLAAVINEQDFAESGRVSEETAAAIGQLEGADLLVMGSVTEFEPDHIGVGGIAMGVVSFGASVAVAMANRDAPVGAVTYLESHIAMDIKIVDAATGRVVHANAVEGRYKKWGGGIIGGVGGGASRTGVGLGGFESTGAEEAVRLCIEKAVAEIVNHTPTEYYRVKETQSTVLANQLLPFYPVTFRNAAPQGPPTREAFVVEDEPSYQALLARLKVNPVDAPVFDWKLTRLLVVFAGEKPTKGHRVNVFKVVEKEEVVEAEVAQIEPPKQGKDDPQADPAEQPQIEPGKDWPYHVVRMAPSEKAVKFIWE